MEPHLQESNRRELCKPFFILLQGWFLLKSLYTNVHLCLSTQIHATHSKDLELICLIRNRDVAYFLVKTTP